MVPLLIKVAKSVDYLEETVQDKHELCSDLGLGSRKAKPINTISPQHLQKFLVTHVLDCLFWAAMPSQSSVVVQDIVHYKHPELAANHVRPQGGAATVKYVALEEDLNTLLDEFLNLIPTRLPAFMAPGLQPPSSEVVLDQSQGLIYMAHSGSAYSGPSAQQGGYLALQPLAPDIAQDQIVPWDQLQEPDQQYLGHTTAGVSALNNAVVTKRHMAMANMWVLATSLLWAIHLPLGMLLHKCMNIGPQARPFLEVFILSRDKDKLPTNSTRLTPASVALCHTPFYLLNPQIDMTRLDFPGQDLSIAKVINAAFTEPPALSARTKASEIMVWKCVGHMLRRIMPLGQPTDFQDHLGRDLQWQLFKDLYEAQKQPRQTLEHDIKEWPHMAQLPPRVEDVAAGKYKVTEADTNEEQNSQGEPTTLPPSVVDNVNHELLMQVSELNALDGGTQNVVNASTLEPVLSTVQLLPPGISPDATAGGGRPPPSLPSSGAQEGMLLPPPPSLDPHQPPPPKLPVPHTPNPTPGLLEQPAAGGKQSIPASLLSGMIASTKVATETQDLPLSHAPSRMPPTQGESVSSVIPSPLLCDPASNIPSSHISSMPLHYPIRNPSPPLPHLTPTPPLPRPSTPEESHITGPALDAELAPLSPLTEFSDDNQEDQTVSAHFEEDDERELNENLLDLLGEYTGGGKSSHIIYDSSSYGARGQVEAGAESSVHVRQEDALQRSNCCKRTGHIPPAYPPTWILPKSKPRRGKRVVQTLDQHGASSKCRISEIESAEDVKPKRARGEKPGWNVNDTTYTLVNYIDLTLLDDGDHTPRKLKDIQLDQVDAKATQEIKAKQMAELNLELPAPPEDVEMDIEENITVVRHVLLEDGQIHREAVEFKMTWPAGMPAQVMNGAQIVDHVISKEHPNLNHDSTFPPPTGNDLEIIPRSLFSDLEVSCGKAEYKSLEERLATRACLILPSTTREEVNSWYRQPILDVGDIVENLMIDVNAKREVHEGAHGLLLSALESSFHIGLREHTKGNEDTNTVHVGTENILHFVTAHYYLEILALYPKTLSQQEPNNEEESPDEPEEEEYEEATEKTISSLIYYAELQAKIPRCPSPMQFACLLCMAAHALAFEPAPVEEDGTVHQYECPEAIYDMHKILCMPAEKLLACVPALWQPMQDCEERIRNSLKGTALQDEFQALTLDLTEPMELDSDL
ncbi:hypothetical protein M422DRAFT_270682 [Sphaerobolus stellatus SS14]|uniref:Uncharacterized protein n=1 Tax=Sphaerobolus stellatus (strain SS14) TaxID=990650 RepID=A0A0C9U1Y5_SPHS4|nr:hypothetical protein M422DRAFT_270682 [Sphaerobolus stellatus SS14]